MKNWVNFEKSATFTEAQLKKRKTAHIRTKYSIEEEMELLRELSLGGKTNKKRKEYLAWLNTIEEDFQQATEDNTKLKKVIEYEKAEIRLSQPIPDLPDKIEVEEEEEGVIVKKEIINPEKLKEIAEREKAQKIIDTAPEVIIEKVEERRPAVIAVIVTDPLFDSNPLDLMGGKEENRE